MVRGTYKLTPQIFATGRIGFVYGLPRTYSSTYPVVGAGGTVTTQTYEVSATYAYIPILVGGRYYLDKTRTGLHGDAELGIYPVWAGVSSSYAGIGSSGSAMSIVGGVNVGAGYVLPGKLPLDLMVEWSTQVGLGLSAGIPLF